MWEIFKVSRRTLYILMGAIAVILLAIGIGVAVFWPAITSATAGQAVTPTPIVSVTGTAKPTAAKILKQYAPDIKNQIAQGLHLTPDQLTTQLQAGETLSDISNNPKNSGRHLPNPFRNMLSTSIPTPRR